MSYVPIESKQQLIDYYRPDYPAEAGYYQDSSDTITGYKYCTKPIYIIVDGREFISYSWYITIFGDLQCLLHNGSSQCIDEADWVQGNTRVSIEDDFSEDVKIISKQERLEEIECLREKAVELNVNLVEKPVVRPSINDRYLENKNHLGASMYYLREKLRAANPVTEFEEIFVSTNFNKMLELLYDMRHGYTVDNEQLYVVPMPTTKYVLTCAGKNFIFQEWRGGNNLNYKETFTKKELDDLIHVYREVSMTVEDYIKKKQRSWRLEK